MALQALPPSSLPIDRSIIFLVVLLAFAETSAALLSSIVLEDIRMRCGHVLEAEAPCVAVLPVSARHGHGTAGVLAVMLEKEKEKEKER